MLTMGPIVRHGKLALVLLLDIRLELYLVLIAVV